jgi:hypothetical protein
MERLATVQAERALDHEFRARNDAETWLAETLEGSMRTPFEYRSDGKELYAEDGGALGPLFADSLQDAAEIVAQNPALHFEYRRRRIEQQEYEDMLRMTRSELPNTMVVVSDFPQELMDSAQDVGGYNVTRKQTMLRVLTWQHGRLRMQTQSLDMSDRAALERLYTYLGFEPLPGELLGQRMHVELNETRQEFLLDELTGVYDRSLQERYGGKWYAGRSGKQRMNTYEFVCKNQDIVQLLAHAYVEEGYATAQKYDLAAAMAKRYARISYQADLPAHSVSMLPTKSYAYAQLMQEIRQAGDEARAEGKVFSGCGASATANGDTTTDDQYSEAGYGNKSQKTEKGVMRCVNCPKCRTYHHELKAIGGLFRCKNKDCGHTASAS